MQDEEIAKLTRFFRTKFELATIQVKKRPQKTDSCEVYIGDEFIGVLYRDDEDEDDFVLQFPNGHSGLRS